MVLWAEREAHKRIGELLASTFRAEQYSHPEFHRAAIKDAFDRGPASIMKLGEEVAALERRCAEAGLTENDIKEFAR
jgi:hypothetical protein